MFYWSLESFLVLTFNIVVKSCKLFNIRSFENTTLNLVVHVFDSYIKKNTKNLFLYLTFEILCVFNVNVIPVNN